MVDWDLVFDTAGFINVPASSKALLIAFPASSIDAIAPATIVRTRMQLMVGSDQAAATEEQVGAFGIGFVNVVAGALGITALPGPITDGSWPGWFVWKSFVQELIFSSAIGINPNFGMTFDIDSKAMRKFSGDQSLVFVAENTHATHGIRVGFNGRMLVKAG